MRVLEVGGDVFLLRFLPDNRRLVVGTADEERKVTFAVLAWPDGGRVPLNVPGADLDWGFLDFWWYHACYGNAIAVHPGGEVCYIAWAGWFYAFRTADGSPLPMPEKILAHQVVLSPDGSRLLAADCTGSPRQLLAVKTSPKGGAVVWRKTLPQEFSQVAGFLPDGERFVTVEDHVRIRSFASGDQLAASRVKPQGAHQPQISQDGRVLGLIGYGSSNFGDFRSFAFHPDGKTVAVIHGGPTLVKVYDLATLQRVHTWKWKLGPLQSVAYSPDGTLGAAGSKDGRIVVWDVDE